MSDDSPVFLGGGGSLGALMSGHDWAASALDAPLRWPAALRLCVSLMLGSKFPMFIAWGPDLAFLYNDAYVDILGDKHPWALGRQFQVIWSEIWVDIHPLVRRAMAGEATFAEDLPLRMRRRGLDEDTWFTFSYSPIHEEDGAVGGMFCACVETTRQVTSERASREDAERLQMALSAGRGIGTWDWDVIGDRVVADERFARLYGVDTQRAKAGAPVAAFFANIHPDDIGRVQERIADALRTGGTFSEEYRLVHPGRSECWVLAEGRCEHAPDGRPLRFPGVSFDITERKAVEADLRELNATLERRIVERSRERGRTWEVTPDLLGVLNLQGYFESVNPAWEAVLGWRPQEVLRMPFFDLLHPDDLEANRVAFAASQKGVPALRLRNRYRHRDGSYRWLSWVAVPEGDKIYCSARDISAAKQAEEELAVAQETLRQSQKMEAVGQLTGGVAHDFNNLLTVIKSSTDLLKRPDLSDERRIRYVGAISDTVDRAAKLTGQLLAFARRQALQPKVFDVGQSVTAVGEMIATLTGSRIEVVVQVPDAPCFIDADPSQFDTALVNMAVNARDAMDGAGRLTITVEPASGIPAAPGHPFVAGAFVTVSIADTGSGIPAGQIGRIFEPFFTTKGVGQGTGLGLSQVFGFAKQSGGEVRVESAAGRGTTFTLYLPEASAHAMVETVSGEPLPLIDGHGTCVLVVEDNHDVGTFATQTLAELGYGTVWASDAAEALAELDRNAERFDVVFSDVVMPGMDGTELAQEIRRRFPNLPVVLTSGYSHVLARNGTYGFELLRKPYSVEELSRILRKAAARARSRCVVGT